MKIIRIVTGAFALLLLLLLPLRVGAENIANIDPTSWDYGEVLIGESETAVFSFESIGPNPLLVDDISIRDDATGSFEITSVKLSGEEVPPWPGYDPPSWLFEAPVGDQVQIEVTFTPYIDGVATAQLYISSDAANYPNLYIPLLGEGVLYMPTPQEMVEELVQFFRDSVASGHVCGEGLAQSADAHLRVFNRMLESAEELIGIPDYSGTCDVLERAALKSDGVSPPPDFIDCDGASEINAMILEVMEALACE